LDRELSAALTPWRKQQAVLDPGKILLDLAISVAVGGDCLADIAVLQSEPAVFEVRAAAVQGPALSTRLGEVASVAMGWCVCRRSFSDGRPRLLSSV